MMKKTKRTKTIWWVVLRLYKWDSIRIGGAFPVRMGAGGPVGFIPIFNTKRGAVAFAGGSKNVVAMEASHEQK